MRLISHVVHIIVILNWVTIFTVLAVHGVPKNIALGAFTIFRITAVLATLWMITEVAEGFAGQTSFVPVLINSLLTLPMFAFWFWVVASSF